MVIEKLYNILIILLLLRLSNIPVGTWKHNFIGIIIIILTCK